MIFKTKKFKIPSKFRFLSWIDIQIYDILIKNHKYDVKSDVSEEVFESFIEYWVHKKIPIFDENNISEYEKLSEEFDLMKDLIQVYKSCNLQIDSLTKEAEFLLSFTDTVIEISTECRNYYKNKEIEYQQIFNILMNSNLINADYKYKKDILKFFRLENFKFVELYSRQIIHHNGLLYSINDEDQTAGILLDLHDQDSFVIHAQSG